MVTTKGYEAWGVRRTLKQVHVFRASSSVFSLALRCLGVVFNEIDGEPRCSGTVTLVR